MNYSNVTKLCHLILIILLTCDFNFDNNHFIIMQWVCVMDGDIHHTLSSDPYPHDECPLVALQCH